MSDGLVLDIRPRHEICQHLLNCKAVWSIVDVDGGPDGRVTKVHDRKRKAQTPLTGAGCEITCSPPSFSEKTGLPKNLSYSIGFYPPAGLMGNNILPENTVRVPAQAALASWKDYMARTYPAVTMGVLDQITIEDCQLRIITMVYLWACETAEEAKELRTRIDRHCTACLDDNTRNRPRDRQEIVIPRDRKNVRPDGNRGGNFYVDTPWGQIRVYIKPRYSKKNFCNIRDPELLDTIHGQASKVVRIEIELDVAKFSYGDKKDECFPLNPAKWTPAFMARDPFEIVWAEIRKFCRFDHSLAKHEPKGAKLEKLPQEYRDVLDDHIAGLSNLLVHSVIGGDRKKLSRIAGRLAKNDIKVDLWLPWKLQQGETSSGRLSDQLQYEKRFRPRDIEGLAEHSLHYGNVESLRDHLLAKIPSMTKPPGSDATTDQDKSDVVRRSQADHANELAIVQEFVKQFRGGKSAAQPAGAVWEPLTASENRFGHGL